MKKGLLIILALLSSLCIQAQQIKVLNLVRSIQVVDDKPNGYIELTAEFFIPIPIEFAGVKNIDLIANTYKSEYKINRIDSGNVVFTFNQSFGIYKQDNQGNETSDIIDEDYLKAVLIKAYKQFEKQLDNFKLLPFDEIIGKEFDGIKWEFKSN